MEFINFYTSEWVDSKNGNEIEEQVNADDRNFIGNIEIDQNPSDYYEITNIMRSFSHAENDALNDYDIKRVVGISATWRTSL